MAGIPIESSSLTFKTREYYLSGSTDSSKGSTLTFEELDNTLIFLSNSISAGSSGIYNSAFYPNTTVPATVGGITINTNVDNFKELYEQCRSVVIDFTIDNNIVVTYANSTPERINYNYYYFRLLLLCLIITIINDYYYY
jgi:hypothetical protein